MASYQDQSKKKSKGKLVASMLPATNEKANWDSGSRELFVTLCAEQVVAGNRPTTFLNKQGWANVRNTFNQRTGKNYVQTQFKNHWNMLKKEWSLWRSLIHVEIGLGIDPLTGTIDASDELWNIKLQRVPEAVKFKKEPLTHLSKLEIMFMDTVATGENAWAPNSGVLPQHMLDDEEESEEDDDTPAFDDIMCRVESGAQKIRKKGELLSRKKKAKRVTTAAKLTNALDKIMEAMTSDTLSSEGNSEAGSRSTICDCLEIMKNMDGLVVGDPLYLLGAHLFKRAADREMFVELPAEARLAWLKAKQSVFFRR